MKKLITVLVLSALMQNTMVNAEETITMSETMTTSETAPVAERQQISVKESELSESVEKIMKKALSAIEGLIPETQPAVPLQPKAQPQFQVTQNSTETLPTWVTKRQLTDLLLNEALTVFKSPARVSHAGFTGKLPSNLEVVADRLIKAIKLEPYRADLLFSLAGAYTANGNTDKAIDVYQTILTKFPGELDAITYLAAWQRYLKNNAVSEQLMNKLQMSDAGRAAKLQNTFDSIDRAITMPVQDEFTQEQRQKWQNGEHVAIVTLGYALNPDGSMHEILIKRLEKTLELANQLPEAIIVTTGGVPQNNQTEAKLMADWLVEKGVKASRIYQDNAARSTVENALFSRYILTNQNIESAIILSSGSHVRRGQALFEIAAADIGAKNIEFSAIAALDKPLADLQVASDSDIKGVYRDALKTMGLWSFRSYPLEER